MAPATGPQKEVAKATDPSGPNSVLRGLAPGFEVPLRRRTGGCTDESQMTQLNGQCSTSVPAAAIDDRDGTTSWTG
jgi:hypothetical protein